MKRSSGKKEIVATACNPCPYEMAYDVQFQKLEENLEDLRERVRRLETVLARGVLLLIANLIGVAGSLTQQWLR